MASRDERVLVSGATGLIGSRLVASLQRDDVLVRALSRSESSARATLGSEVEIAVWDGVRLPAEAATGCSAVVHLAGEPVFGGRLTAVRRERILSSRIDSTDSIAALLARSAGSVRTFVCSSAVGYYGDRGDEWLEESAGPGSGFLAEVCQQWEAAAGVAADAVRVVSLRTGIALSRGGGALPTMAMPIRLGLGGPLGDGRQWVPWVHVDDVVRMIRAALDDETFIGPLNVVSPNPVRNVDLTRAIARRLRRPSVLRAPAFVVRAALGELSDEILGSRRCAPRAALDRGFEFAHAEIDSALAAELGGADREQSA